MPTMGATSLGPSHNLVQLSTHWLCAEAYTAHPTMGCMVPVLAPQVSYRLSAPAQYIQIQAPPIAYQLHKIHSSKYTSCFQEHTLAITMQL